MGTVVQSKTRFDARRRSAEMARIEKVLKETGIGQLPEMHLDALCRFLTRYAVMGSGLKVFGWKSEEASVVAVLNSFVNIPYRFEVRGKSIDIYLDRNVCYFEFMIKPGAGLEQALREVGKEVELNLRLDHEFEQREAEESFHQQLFGAELEYGEDALCES